MLADDIGDKSVYVYMMIDEKNELVVYDCQSLT